MITGNKYTLAKTITGVIDKKVFGKKGDEVKLIEVNDHIGFVQDENGEIFPVNTQFLEVKVELEVVKAIIPEAVPDPIKPLNKISKAVKKNKKASPIIQQPNLF